MRNLLTILGISCALAVPAAGQNLANGDFETWSGGQPVDWGLQWGGPLLSQETGVTLCGSSSCRLEVPAGVTSLGFGKSFDTAQLGSAGNPPTPGVATLLPPGDVLNVCQRVQLDLTGAMVLPTSRVRLRAWAVDTATGTQLGSPSINLLDLSDTGWQEPHVTFVVPASDLDIKVRFAVLFQDLPGAVAYLDQTSFRFSSPSFGTQGDLCADDPYRLLGDDLLVEIDSVSGNLQSVVHRGEDARDLADDTELLIAEGSSLVWGRYDEASHDGLQAFSTGDLQSVGQRAGLTLLEQSVAGSSGAVGEERAQTLRLSHDIDLDGDGTVDVVTTTELLSDPGQDGVTIETTLAMDGAAWRVEELRSPQVEFIPDLPSSGVPTCVDGSGVEQAIHMPEEVGDRVFMPIGSGVVLGRETFLGSDPSRHSFQYPGNASMQFVSYFNQEVGVAMAALDGQGQPKRLGHKGETDGDRVELVITQLNEWNPGSGIDASESVPVRLFATQGSWMHAADVYRDWARQQTYDPVSDEGWWTKKNPAGRAAHPALPDAPLWIDERPHLVYGNLRPLGNGAFAVDSDEWDEFVWEWEQQLGNALITLHRQFERYGTYAGPYYTPFDTPWYTRTEVEDIWSTIEGVGHHPLVQTASLKWLTLRAAGGGCAWWAMPFPDQGFGDSTVADVAGCGGPTQCVIDADQGGGQNDLGLVYPDAVDVCTQDKDGNVVLDTPTVTWDGFHHHIDSASAFATQLHTALAAYMGQRDVHVYHFDQLTGGGTQVSYADDHGHEPGYGEWMADSVHDLLEDTRAAGRAVQPDMVTSIELPGELFIPVMDLFFVGINHLDEWPANNADAAVVPAFQYVYSEIAPTMSRQVSLNVDGHPQDGLSLETDLARLAKVFTSGSWVSFAHHEHQLLYDDGTWDGTGCRPAVQFPDPGATSPDAVTLLTNLNAFKPVIDPYFNHGYRIRDEGAQIGCAPIVEQDNGTTVTRYLPDVWISAWQQGSERRVVVVNPSDTAVDLARLPDRLDGQAITDGSLATVHFSDGTQAVLSYNGGSLSIPPLNALVIDI